MKKLILFLTAIFILVSCSTIPLEISEKDGKLRMVGGKEALLDAIKYPEFALLKGIEGVVTVLAYVDTGGHVIDCKIVDGNEYLNAAAIAAMEEQRFYPYILEGEARPVRVAIPIAFTISKDIDVPEIESARILEHAQEYLQKPVLTLSDISSARSPGNKNDYYSEALTWWPNSADPEGPYVIKDGNVNPDAFRRHADLLNLEGKIISGLTAAYTVSGRKAYAEKAVEHISAWLIDPDTRMEAHLKYAQSIPNRSIGRNVGVIEGLPLVEIIRSMENLRPFFTKEEINSLQDWMKDYRDFLENDDLNRTLMARKDIYAMAGLVQMTAISIWLEDEASLEKLQTSFENNIMRSVVENNSPFLDPQNNAGTAYDIYIMADLMAAEAQLLSEAGYSAWGKEKAVSRRPGDLINVMYSGLLNYTFYESDIYNGRYLSLLLAGKAYDNPRYLSIWRDLNASVSEEVFPIREAVLWVK